MLKPGGVLAVWICRRLSVSPQVDAIIDRLYADMRGPYWPRERAMVDDGYQTLAFPFKPLSPPGFAMQVDWSLPALLGYMGTWSAVQRYRAAMGGDPVNALEGILETAWGGARRQQRVHGPLSLRVGRNTQD